MVSLRGRAVKTFLQGYLTCNSDRIEKNAPTPMTLCNLKGRVIANGWALGDDEEAALVVHGSLAEAVGAFLKPYAMFSKIQIQASHEPVGVIQDPAAPGVLCSPWAFADGVFAPVNATGEDRSTPIAHALIDQSFAWVSAPVSGKFLPQVLGMPAAGAVDFDKGCYLGQEIIARAQFRGAVKRGVDHFSFSGDTPAPGDNWEDPEYGSGTVILTTSQTQSDRPDLRQGLWVRNL